MFQKLFILIAVFLGFSLFVIPTQEVFSQSKTEEAKERLKGNSRGSSGGSSFFFSFAIEVMPTMFYFTPLQENEPRIGYSPSPYRASQFGIREFGYDNRTLFDASFTYDMPLTGKATQVRNANMRMHYGYWAFRGGYNQYREHNAPYAIHDLSVSVERKFRFLPQSDGGFFMGYREFQLLGDRFPGFDMGVDLSFYPFNPVSFQYIYAITVVDQGFVDQHRLMVHAHQGQFRFTVSYSYLDILGVGFSGLSAGVGFFF